MRVISQDGTINVPYERNMFAIIEEEEKFYVGVRDYNHCILLTDPYQTKGDARAAFNKLISAGETNIIPNGTFKFS